MTEMRPTLCVVAGPNGSGKTHEERSNSTRLTNDHESHESLESLFIISRCSKVRGYRLFQV